MRAAVELKAGDRPQNKELKLTKPGELRSFAA
jgi:hypothetical protein